MAFCWLYRFLETADTAARSLLGIVEADETHVLASRKGDCRLDRKARNRGGPAHKRGTPKEHTPILVAADRGGATFSAVLPDITAQAVERVVGPVLELDALLISDGSSVSIWTAPRRTVSATRRSTSPRVNACAASSTSRPSTTATKA